MKKKGDVMYLFQRIEELILECNDTRKDIGEFLLKEKSEVSNYSMQNIAQKTFTSKSTLFRFAQNLGYNGWREFISDFIKEARYQENNYTDIDPNLPFNEMDSPKDIVLKISTLQIESIYDTSQNIDYDILERATKMLIESKNIVVFGMSPNNILANLFRRKMESIGRLVYIPTLDESGITSRALSSDDCAIVISYSGNNEMREPMRYISDMKANGVKLIGITSGGNNYIRDEIDTTLCISSREKLYTKISSFATEESINHILNILYSCYFAMNYSSNLDYKMNNSRELEYRRRASLIKMKEEHR